MVFGCLLAGPSIEQCFRLFEPFKIEPKKKNYISRFFIEMLKEMIN